MKQTHRFLLLIMIAGGLNLSAQATQDTLTLQAAIDLALRKNHALLISELEGQKLLMQERELRSNLLPNIEAYSTLSYFYAIPRMLIPGEIFGLSGKIPMEFGSNYDWNSGLRFSQLIYNQSYFTSLKMMDELIALQGLSQQLQGEEIVYQLAVHFKLCLSIKDRMTVFDSTIHSMTRLLAIVELQAKNGIARKADMERVAIDISKLEIEKLRLSESYMQALNILKILTGIDPGIRIYPEGNSMAPIAPLRDYNASMHDRIELQIINKKRDASALELSKEKQSRWPVLAAFGQHYYLGMRDEFDFFNGGDDRFFKTGVIGLQIQLPLFNGLARQSRIRIKEIELSQIDTHREQMLMQCNSEYLEAKQIYQNSLTTLRRETKNLEAASAIYQANLAGYKQQIVSLTDLILSEYQLTKTRMDLYGAQFNAEKSELSLMKITGVLMPEHF
jgi:outer membrane protein